LKKREDVRAGDHGYEFFQRHPGIVLVQIGGEINGRLEKGYDRERLQAKLAHPGEIGGNQRRTGAFEAGQCFREFLFDDRVEKVVKMRPGNTDPEPSKAASGTSS
jgi:hypothetical protein